MIEHTNRDVLSLDGFFDFDWRLLLIIMGSHRSLPIAGQSCMLTI